MVYGSEYENTFKISFTYSYAMGVSTSTILHPSKSVYLHSMVAETGVYSSSMKPAHTGYWKGVKRVT